MVIADASAHGRHVRAGPKDVDLVALARTAGAHAIVTGDRRLLEVEGLRPPALEQRAFLAWLERLNGTEVSD